MGRDISIYNFDSNREPKEDDYSEHINCTNLPWPSRHNQLVQSDCYDVQGIGQKIRELTEALGQSTESDSEIIDAIYIYSIVLKSMTTKYVYLMYG